jgi:hypothetical protein
MAAFSEMVEEGYREIYNVVLRASCLIGEKRHSSSKVTTNVFGLMLS